MEEVLEIYDLEPTEGVARVCFDERPCQLIDDVFTPLPMKQGKARKIDHNYERKGTCALLLAYDIDRGERYVQISKQRRKIDYAKFMDWLETNHYKSTDRIHLIQDNLNTHCYGSFYENLPVERASELRHKINFHFTPKNGSWLNMAEIEFSSASRQCLNRRIGTIAEISKEINAWTTKRNHDKVKISWSFTVPKAREKMENQYIKVYDNV